MVIYNISIIKYLFFFYKFFKFNTFLNLFMIKKTLKKFIANAMPK